VDDRALNVVDRRVDAAVRPVAATDL